MTAQRVCVFQHVACEDLGTFAEVITGRGFQARYVRLFAGDRIPSDWPAAGALIYLGGPMSVNDETEHPYLSEERATIRVALEQGKPILGVCLGAQLLAAAAGARIFPGRQPELGWKPIALTADGRQDPVLTGLADLAAVFHWHGETFDLPSGATHLASSTITPHQAFRLGNRAYGLQFHLEVDAAMIETWVDAYRQDLGPHADAARHRIVRDTALHADALHAAARRTMNRFLDLAS